MPDFKNDTLIDHPFTGTRRTSMGKPRPTLTVLSGTDIGKVFLLNAGPSIIGRSPDVSVHIPHESISRRHCELVVKPSGHTFIRDLGSTNGTRVDDVEMSSNHTVLAGGERLRLSKKVVLKFAYQDKLERTAQEDLYSNAVRDALTGTYNKRFFMERAEHEVTYAARHNSPLSLIIFDLDHFKQVNDTHGHTAGDAALIETAARVHNILRSEDVLARYGGEEFVVLMRNTPIEEATHVAERIRQAVSADPIVNNGTPIAISVSVGIATHNPKECPNTEALITLADSRLYKAKAMGRDRVVSN